MSDTTDAAIRTANRKITFLIVMAFGALAWGITRVSSSVDQREAQNWTAEHTRRWIAEFHRLNPAIELPDTEAILRGPK